MLKLTTDKHEASRGLSATAELLVCFRCTADILRITPVRYFNVTSEAIGLTVTVCSVHSFVHSSRNVGGPMGGPKGRQQSIFGRNKPNGKKLGKTERRRSSAIFPEFFFNLSVKWCNMRTY